MVAVPATVPGGREGALAFGAMFQLSLPEILLILTIALLVFGPRRLPEMGRSLGRGLRELRSALDGVKIDDPLAPDADAREATEDDELDEMIADGGDLDLDEDDAEGSGEAADADPPGDEAAADTA